MVDYDIMAPRLQLFAARFLNFSPVGREIRDFQVREMLT